ncbi:bifunctional diaminohydroxyphosphoribosylaminopyrimidine deaminase/5-amino-6-(5-phosphoribosylamino)uracil reductase RibD [Candidatus Cetobacterium colombiensis]|uniref:Riboflavin biosynthesis protein RibD n=1 Tax=Candidatus Cetobacterium colombiensis TaxID=3073100 RepID=A0ABU4W9L7_9FUSO|nr:bifunctional diaminohydroxyphosphoribosylaminopyrimidine deaminase/5-amino-6-(5-phosphoribosylamino)uracil reductase RibD [Candidatus Cetobacterium colombiensis]MDX8335394.1 bifunctional diaminohydroxyphosphoribosylaminopyrimidine deaminase/5-amino-6-(5-phosphoribosylamino)uracil reductase RibD [Candidatus Cetobacterium colombiensis]
MHEHFMRIAIEEAKKGIGAVNPNPLVGAVIVKNNKIISVGHHEFYGGPHAEVNALKNLESVEGATLYVTLEPCSHFGKTPPCTELIIKSKIKTCIVGTLDPNPLVSGRGIKQLKDAGIEVIIGVLENETKNLNRVFFKYIQNKIPYIFIKCGITLDGKIATKNFSSKWITNSLAREKVEKYRNFFSGILVGANTVIQDNPSLRCKVSNHRNPYRLILDKDLIIDEKYSIINNNSDCKTFIITLDKNIKTKKFQELKEKFSINFITFSKEENLMDILSKIGSYNIDSVLVEGGSSVLSLFFKESLFDGGEIIIAPKILGDNSAIPFLNGFSPNLIDEGINLENVKFNIYDNNVGVEFYKEDGCLPV